MRDCLMVIEICCHASPPTTCYIQVDTSYFLPAVAQLQQEIERIKKDKEALNSAISSVNSVKTPKTGAR